MPRYLFTYHGGTAPETPEEGAREMARWTAWFAEMGEAVVDDGAPVGMSKTVSAAGVADDGGANPVSGYSVIQAMDFNAAIAFAKACPILPEGSIEIAEIMDI